MLEIIRKHGIEGTVDCAIKLGLVPKNKRELEIKRLIKEYEEQEIDEAEQLLGNIFELLDFFNRDGDDVSDFIDMYWKLFDDMLKQKGCKKLYGGKQYE